MKTLLLVLILTVITKIFPDKPVLTSTCEEFPTIEEGFIASDIVISGKIISEEPSNDADLIVLPEAEMEEDHSGADEIEYRRFRAAVQHIYKGKVNTEMIMIKTPAEESACGFTFAVGREYIIYGWVADNNQADNRLIKNNVSDLIFATNLCTRTREWNPEEHGALVLMTKKL